MLDEKQSAPASPESQRNGGGQARSTPTESKIDQQGLQAHTTTLNPHENGHSSTKKENHNQQNSGKSNYGAQNHIHDQQGNKGAKSTVQSQSSSASPFGSHGISGSDDHNHNQSRANNQQERDTGDDYGQNRSGSKNVTSKSKPQRSPSPPSRGILRNGLSNKNDQNQKQTHNHNSDQDLNRNHPNKDQTRTQNNSQVPARNTDSQPQRGLNSENGTSSSPPYHDKESKRTSSGGSHSSENSKSSPYSSKTPPRGRETHANPLGSHPNVSKAGQGLSPRPSKPINSSNDALELVNSRYASMNLDKNTTSSQRNEDRKSSKPRPKSGNYSDISEESSSRMSEDMDVFGGNGSSQKGRSGEKQGQGGRSPSSSKNEALAQGSRGVGNNTQEQNTKNTSGIRTTFGSIEDISNSTSKPSPSHNSPQKLQNSSRWYDASKVSPP